MKATQCEKIVEYMKEHGSITQIQAFVDIGCFRLASRISDLKKQGYAIRSEMVKVKNRYDEDVQVAKYSLVGVENSADNGM